MTFSPCGRAKRATIGVGALLFALNSCGGRVARPVEAVRPFDDNLTCVHIVQELKSNSDRIADLRGEVRAQNDNNAGLVVVSPLFLNVNDSEEEEVKALAARNQRLVALGQGKSCPVAAKPADAPVPDDKKQ